MKPLVHLWSLGIEEQFYIVWPLVLWAVFRFGRRVGTDMTNRHVTIRHVTVTTVVLMVASFVLGLLAIVSFGRPTPLLERFGAGRAHVAALLIASGPHTWWGRHVLSRRLMVGVGLVSYPLYLWHWPLLVYARIMASGVPASGMTALVSSARQSRSQNTQNWPVNGFLRAHGKSGGVVFSSLLVTQCSVTPVASTALPTNPRLMTVSGRVTFPRRRAQTARVAPGDGNVDPVCRGLHSTSRGEVDSGPPPHEFGGVGVKPGTRADPRLDPNNQGRTSNRPEHPPRTSTSVTSPSAPSPWGP